MQELMYQVVNGTSIYPTGTKYKVKGYEVMGKTGTAQIADPRGGYLEGKYNYVKSFASIFPKSDPQIILYASTSKYYGTLANRIKPVIENIGKYINVEADTTEEKEEELKIKSYINKTTKSSIKNLKTNKLNTIVIGDGKKVINQYPKKGTIVNENTKVFLLTNSTNYIMPDVTGWSTGEITNFGNLIGLEFNFSGYGFATSQSLAAGSKINVSKKVSIKLETKYVNN